MVIESQGEAMTHKETLQTLELLIQMGSDMTKDAATARKEMDEVYAKLKCKLK